MMNSDGASPGPEVRTQAHWGHDLDRNARRELEMHFDGVVAFRADAVPDDPVVAAYEQHGARVKGRGRQPSIPVLHALEIVTARPRLPGGDGAVSNVPQLKGPRGIDEDCAATVTVLWAAEDLK